MQVSESDVSLSLSDAIDSPQSSIGLFMSVALLNGADAEYGTGSEGCIVARRSTVPERCASFDASLISQSKMQIVIGDERRTMSQHTTTATAPVFRRDLKLDLARSRVSSRNTQIVHNSCGSIADGSKLSKQNPRPTYYLTGS